MDRKITVRHEARLLEYLFEVFHGMSRTGVKSFLTRGQVEVNGKAVSAFDFPLVENDVITIMEHGRKRPPKEGSGPLPKGLGKQVRIVHEDDDIIVAEKASGLLTMSTGNEDEITAYSILTEYVRAGYRGKGERPRIFIVHRIDRETSGLLVFAKTPQAKHGLQEGWNDCVLERKYVAILERAPEMSEGTVTSWLKDNPVTKFVTSSPTDNGGKKATTHYRVIETYGQSYSLVEFELETGRKNQIRVHASVIGHPIAGDRKYGAASNPIGRLALHARTLSFRHPVTGEVLMFDSGIPIAFRKFLKNRYDTNNNHRKVIR